MGRALFALLLLFLLGTGGACTAPSRPQTGDDAVETSSQETPILAESSRMERKGEGEVFVALNHLSPTCLDVVNATLRDVATHQEKPAERWRWLVNGQERVSDSPIFPSGVARRGDELMAEAVYPSKTGELTVRSRKLLVANALPRVAGVSLNKLNPGRGETLRVSATGEDPDGDPVRLTYRWLVDGKIVQEGEKNEYRLVSEKKGDQIHCEVLSHDGFAAGNWSATPVVEVTNSPPRFLAKPPSAAGPDGSFSYQVSVEDPDGDPVKIELLKGPAGMALDRDTIRWRPEAGFRGEAAVVIRITDGAGGETRQEFTLLVASG